MGGEYRLPDKKALFSLIPANPKALDVVEDTHNDHLISWSPRSNVKSFDIGFHIDNRSSKNTLATLGRNGCNIYLKPSSISRVHCSFEIDDLDSGIVMFYDRSHKHNTRVSGENSIPFERGRAPRKVLVHPGLNETISLGGVNGTLFEFRIEWIQNEQKIIELARARRAEKQGTITNPREARTFDPSETVLPSLLMTPEQAFETPGSMGIRYFKQELKGNGSYGTVWQAIDVDSGRVMAMKQIRWVRGQHDRNHIRKVRREVELMRIARHVRILLLMIDRDDTDSWIAAYRRLNHITRLGGKLLYHSDLCGPRGEKFRHFEH